MMKSIYSIRQHLAQYDLDTKLFNQFNLEAYEAYPLRSIFIIKTNKGSKILKKINYSKEELMFIENGLKYVENNFPRIMKYVKTKDGKIYTEWGNYLYCIIELIEGRESDFNNPIDVNIATEGLANFHLAGEGFQQNLNIRNNAGKMIDNFKRKLNELKLFKDIVNIKENRNEFDFIFLDNIDHYLEEIEKSIGILKDSNYYKLCSEEDKKVFCHHDLAYHNIIIKNNQAYFIDFDYSIIDLKVHDLCNFIVKTIKNSAFDIKKCNSILETYSNINSIDNRELDVLYGFLTFPQDFYSISKAYYSNTKDWEENVFLNRLKKKVDMEEFRMEFLQDFKILM